MQRDDESKLEPTWEEKVAKLGPRNAEVFRLYIYAGLTVADISKRLNISRPTVGDHIKTLYRVFRVHRHAELMALARIHGTTCTWTSLDANAEEFVGHNPNAYRSVYSTECRETHAFDEGTPKENSFKFCCYCGNMIKELSQ